MGVKLETQTSEGLEVKLPKLPDWVTTIYYQSHTCSDRSGTKEFNVVINERTLEVRPAWEVYPVMGKKYGSRCSGEVNKWTDVKHVLEKAGEGWVIIKNVEYNWYGGRKEVNVTYYHILEGKVLEHERDHDGEYFDRITLPDGRVLKVYKNRVEVVE